ncbi:MAG: glycoside hydrolase family 3 N-terminal domain-containing protein [Elusimicrobia bacterium]|nr:glycoside hydrolase family 3 N-terminal domain-containing protein [Elusimicrobiota bacterium]
MITVEQLSLEQKVGQMFMARGPLTGNKFREEIIKLAKEGKLTGLSGFRGVAEKAESYKKDIDFLKSISPIPMLYATNTESGAPLSSLPYVIAFGAIGSEDYAYRAALLAGRRAKAIGCNMTFSPVLDVAFAPDSCVINIRSISSNISDVCRLGTAMVKGYQDAGLIPTPKQYPGCGRSPVDPHIEPSIVDCDEKTFNDEELEIYRYCIKHGNPRGIMSGHTIVTSVDPDNLCTTSKKLVTILRKMGFEGILITDSLAMRSIKLKLKKEDIFRETLASGHDILLADYDLSPIEQISYMLKAVKDGYVSEEQINTSVKRILDNKSWADNNKGGIEKLTYSDLGEDYYKLSLEVSRKAITMTGNFERIGSGKGTLFIVVPEENKQNLSSKETGIGDVNTTDYSLNLKKTFPEAQVLTLPSNLTADDVANALDATIEYSNVIFSTYALPSCYKGPADIPGIVLSLISGLRNKIKVMVLFGNPYAGRHLPKLPCVIYPYYGGFVEQAAIELLQGKLKPTGKLPVKF